jgi:hypothetical protein
MYGRGVYANRVWKACGVLIKFLLQGVHRFESPRLSNMSNRLFISVGTWLIIGILFINDYDLLLITYLTTLIWLSLDLSFLKSNEFSFYVKV